ncbi:MAG TPA: hypothetical protein VIS71_04490 [Terrimicrobium sp.]
MRVPRPPHFEKICCAAASRPTAWIRLGILAAGVISLSLWLIASGFTKSSLASAAACQAMARPSQTACLGVPGTVLLAGVVVLLVLIFRRQ